MASNFRKHDLAGAFDYASNTLQTAAKAVYLLPPEHLSNNISLFSSSTSLLLSLLLNLNYANLTYTDALNNASTCV